MRLVTRSDFDGLACGALLKHLGVIDSWLFVHPKDLQDGVVEVTENDVLANVPYVKGCGMWFDHHTSETLRLGDIEFEGSVKYLDSAAHVIYDYYKDSHDIEHMLGFIEAVDKVDSGKLSVDDLLNPKGWVLLGFIMDPRTGLGRFRDFRISNYQLMSDLIDMCVTQPVEKILQNPDVAERITLYLEQFELFKTMVQEHTTIHDNVIVTDLRGVDTIYAGNRFVVYSLYPEQNISLWVVDGRAKMNVPIACGYSIINRTATADVGNILLGYGGGGHKQVGTCQVPYADSDRAIQELVEKFKN